MKVSTVGELKKLLETIEDDMPIRVSKDLIGFKVEDASIRPWVADDGTVVDCFILKADTYTY